MIYWKKIYAGNYLKYSEEIMNHFYNNKTDEFTYINDFWNPMKESYKNKLVKENIELLELENLYGEINEIAVLVSNADTITLHIDQTVGLNKNVKARLNIPVLNCENSVTAFFKLADTIFNMHSVSKGGTLFWPRNIRDTVLPVSTVTIDSPTIIRTSEPHTVFCDKCNFPRIAITISFKEDLVKFLN